MLHRDSLPAGAPIGFTLPVEVPFTSQLTHEAASPRPVLLLVVAAVPFDAGACRNDLTLKGLSIPLWPLTTRNRASLDTSRADGHGSAGATRFATWRHIS